MTRGKLGRRTTPKSSGAAAIAAKKKKPKFYVVWSGREVGVFDTWDACAKQTAGFAGAKFKAFPTAAAARAAFIDGDAGAHVDYSGGKPKADRPAIFVFFVVTCETQSPAAADYPTGPALCVDAACDTTRWVMECRGVWLGGDRDGGGDGDEAFAFGPFDDANGNLGEFLALATALRLASPKRDRGRSLDGVLRQHHGDGVGA